MNWRAIGRFWIMALASLVGFSGCQQAEKSNPAINNPDVVEFEPSRNEFRAKAELSLREVVFRHLFAESKFGNGDILFISFGRSDDEHNINPPAGFLNRFVDFKGVLLPVSEAQIGEENEDVFSGRIVTQQKTDKQAYICYVRIRAWNEDNSVEVDSGWWQGPLVGEGVMGAVYEYVDGKWQLKKEGEFFVS